MRLLVCGDRNWTNPFTVYDAIRELLVAPAFILEGGARGADTIAHDIAHHLGIPHKRYFANWTQLGKAAGAIRNRWMLEKGNPDHVLAFHGDIKNSKGTKHMIEIAKKAGVPVTLVEAQ